ncbi:MAG: hypothetical protein ABL958_09800 [Bdellovibrionia bacterium]
MSAERHFLHDLVGPLSAASNLLEILLEGLKDDPNPKDLTLKLEKILNSMEAANGLVAARREYLVSTGDGK